MLILQLVFFDISPTSLPMDRGDEHRINEKGEENRRFQRERENRRQKE